MRAPFRLPTSRRQQARDLDDEVELHLALRAEALERQGYSTDAARAEAERQFGDARRVRAECAAIDDANRAAGSRRRMVEELGQDLRLAARSLRRDRSFAVATLLLIALGIGASTAIFSLVNGVILRPVPGADPERTMWVTQAEPDGQEGVSPAVAMAWQERARSFERLATVRGSAVTVTGIDEPQRLDGLRVGEGFLAVMGLRASPGRDFTSADYASGHPPVVVISQAVWQERFGGARSAVGASLTLDGVAHTIVGVLPTAMHGVGTPPSFLIPDALPSAWRNNVTPFLDVVGRLRPGISAGEANIELQGLAEAQVRAAGRALEGQRVRVLPLVDRLTAPFRDRVLLLFAAVLCVLVIACVNVTSLLLARGAGRAREVAVRTSLGASRGRLVRQLLTEHAALAVAGGVAGVAVAGWLVRMLVLLLPRDLPRLADVTLDGASLAFGAAMTVATVLVAGVFPAVRSARVAPNAVLQDGGRGASSGAGSDRVRRTFVVLEVALSAVMLVAAGLLLRSAVALGGVSPGFAPDGVLTARYTLSSKEYPQPAQVLAAHGSVLQALREGDSTGAALTSSIPLGEGSGGTDFHLVGGASATVDVNAALRFVSPGYLQAMGVTLVSGRDFSRADDAGAPRRIIVSEALAAQLGIPGAAEGRQVAGTSSPFRDERGEPIAWEIVGVVREPRDEGLRSAPRPQVFIPLDQTPPEVFDWSARSVHVVMRSEASHAQAIARIVAALRRVNPNLPVYDVMTMRERLRASMALEQANTVILAGLGVAALVLAVSGLYGVVSYGVRQREREFGVRMALGADGPSIVRMVVRWGGMLTVVGLALGIPLAIAGGHALRTLLFGVTAYDPLTIGVVAIVLLGATTLSCLVPAWRASAVAPDAALRA